MQSIKAAVCRAYGAPLIIEDILIAPPGMGEVEVALDAVAICHSDIGSIPTKVQKVPQDLTAFKRRQHARF